MNKKQLQNIFQDYTLSYNDFLASINQTEVVEQLAIKFLDCFPNQLPDRWFSFYQKMISELTKYLPMGMVESIKCEDPFMGALIMSGIFYNRVYQEPIHYMKTVASIYLVMHFSHISAFMGESLRVIARVKPEIVPKYNNITDWEDKLDRFIKTATMPNLQEIIQTFADVGLPLDISPSIDLAFLERAELQRHAYTHNGGRANRTYIKKSNDSRFKIGEDIVFIEWVQLRVYITNLGTDVYRSVCNQLLKQPDAPYWKIGEPAARPPEQVENIEISLDDDNQS